MDVDNTSDPDCTVLTVEGKDQPHLLMTLSGALTTAGYTVAAAVSGSRGWESRPALFLAGLIQDARKNGSG